jgi:tetratricopeptide (TPR) repeat protein
MRPWGLSLALITVLLTLEALSAATQQDLRDCAGSNPELWITACTRVIEDRNVRGDDRAFAHFRRGSAHFSRHDADKAIADFSEAIRLKPGIPESHEHRGLAYGVKGDFERAIADITATAVAPTRPRAISTAPSPTSRRRSGSIHVSRSPTWPAATRIAQSTTASARPPT